MRSVVYLLVLSLLSYALPVHASDWLFGVNAGLVRIDNLPRARLVEDNRDDSVLEVDFRAERPLPWRAPGIFSANLWLGIDQYDRYTSLNQRRAGLGASYHHRLGLGPDAPWWAVDARVGYNDHDYQARNGTALQLDLAAGVAWTEALSVSGGIGYEQRDGRGGATGLNQRRVHDLSNWYARADLDYSFGQRYGLFAGLGLRRGDINTSTTAAGMTTGTWADDPTFGPGWRTYRVDARVVTITFGSQIELGPATQFLVAWERLDGRARGTGAEYDTTIYRLQLQHGF